MKIFKIEIAGQELKLTEPQCIKLMELLQDKFGDDLLGFPCSYTTEFVARCAKALGEIAKRKETK